MTNQRSGLAAAQIRVSGPATRWKLANSALEMAAQGRGCACGTAVHDSLPISRDRKTFLFRLSSSCAPFAIAAAGLFAYPADALAQCVTGQVITSDQGSVTNSGNVDCVYIQNSTITGDVTNTPTGVLTAPGQAISIVDNDPVLTTVITGNVQNQGTATGVEGIIVNGAVVQGDVSNTGTLSGGFYGIRLVNGASAGSITNSNSLSGGATGIILDGSTVLGAITNQATATITSNGNGIHLINGSSAGSIINAGTLTAGEGILMQGSTTGAISNTGAIDAAFYGIRLAGGSTAASITNAGTLTGDWEGILIDGSTVAGAVTNEANSTLTGGFNGIRLTAGSSAGSIINAGTLTAGEGILMQGSTTGAISNTGAIDAAFYGIRLAGDSTAVSITNAGTLTGDWEGILIDGSTVTDTIANQANATLTGGINGIRLTGGSSAASITNAGTLNATYEGILVQGSTTGAIGNTGAVDAGYYGVHLSGGSSAASIINAGALTGDLEGILIDGSTVAGAITNQANSTLTGGINGIRLTGGSSAASITNAGTFDVGGSGILVEGSTVTGAVTNTGSITGAAGAGIGVYAGGTVQNGITIAEGGSVSAYAAVHVNGAGSVVNGGIVNEGTLTGVGNGAAALSVGFGATVNGGIRNRGDMIAPGLNYTISIGAATVTGGINNEGTISGGIEAINVTNSNFTGGITNSGAMSASFSRGITIGGGTFSGGITNTGTITSQTNQAITAEAMTTFSGDMNNSGTAHGGSGGISFLTVGTVDGRILNSGTISGNWGLTLVEVGTVTGGVVNEASGRIVGDEYGFFVGGAPGTALTLTNDGLIQGGTEAINSTKGLTINQQAGSIDGNVVLSNGTTTVDQLNLSAGTMTGTTSFGAGADGMLWTGGTIFATDFGDDGDSAIMRGLTQATIGTTVMNGGLDTDALTFDGTTAVGAAQYRNWETAQLINGSQLSLNGNFVLGDSGTGTGDFTIDSRSALLAGGGDFGVVPYTQGQHGTFSNAGLVDLTNGGTGAGDTFTVGGNYAGSDGVLQLQTVLGGDDSDTDLLQIDGNTSGNTTVLVTNLGGAGAPTQEGIKIVNVDGADSAGSFNLLGNYVLDGEQTLMTGAYNYRLYQGSVSDPDDGDWYLRNTDEEGNVTYQPGVPVYEAYAGAALGFIDIGTLQQRVGNRSWTVIAQGADDISGVTEAQGQVGLWAEVLGFGGSWQPESTTGADYDLSSWKLKAGLDVPLTQTQNGELVGGLSLHYGTYSADVSSPSGDGSIDGSGYGVGGTLTWYGNNGFYIDGQAQVTWFDSDLDSDVLGNTLVEGNDGVGYALSIEAGKRMELTPTWAVTPQAQLIYSAVDLDDFVDPLGAPVKFGSADNFVGRLGITLDRQTEWQSSSGSNNRSHLYGIANLYYDFDGGANVDVAGVGFESENDALWGGVGLGGSLNFADDKYSVYGEALAKTSLENFGDSYSVKGTLGFRVNW